jgi:hypothetical protein
MSHILGDQNLLKILLYKSIFKKVNFYKEEWIEYGCLSVKHMKSTHELLKNKN